MLSHYLAVALRSIRGAPLASAVNLLTLAVGLVCFVTAYAFTTFWGAAERHFPKARDTYVLTISVKQGELGMENATSTPDVAAEFLRTDFPAISQIARADVIDPQTMVASGGQAVRMFGVAADAELLEIFDLPFVAGDARSALASPRSAVITREYAIRLFGADDPIGKSILIGNAVDAAVTGVIDAIPEPSHFGRSAHAEMPFDLLVSRDVHDALRGMRGGEPLPAEALWWSMSPATYLYLPPAAGLTAGALAAQFDAFVARHVPAELRGDTPAGYRFGLMPVKDLLAGGRDLPGTGLSFAAGLLLLAGLVLGVACVNYANLATARAARRVREIGVRKAIGASPAQIAVQSLFDAGAFTLAALLVALAVFVAAQPLVKRLLGAELDGTFFATLAVWPALGALVVVVALAAGAYPAFVLSRVRPVSAIAVGQARLGSAWFSTLLVGTQFGVASFLLIAVTVISMQNVEMRRTAFSAIEDPLVIIENPTPQTKVTSATLRERLDTVPQVRGVTELLITPWEGQLGMDIATSPDPTAPQRTTGVRPIGFDFFDVFNLPLVTGRVFDRDHAEDAPRPLAAAPADSQALPVNIVVDRAFVAELGLGTPQEAIDKLVYAAGRRGRLPSALRIIGVVEDRSFNFFKTGGNGVVMYTIQNPLRITVARVSATDIDAALAGIDAVWRELAPNVALNRRFLDEVFERAYSRYVRANRLFAVLAVMAFGICVAGLFGMAIFVAGRRRREIGVRKTLGATTGRMVTLLLAGFSKPVVVANLIAWPAGYFAARAYLNQFSPSIELTLWPFVLSLAITLAIACIAVAGQTVRAARTTPAEVLRQD